MKIRSLRPGRHGSSKMRRQAAQIVVDETLTGVPSQLARDASAELRTELTSMRELTQLLEQLPGQAWAAELGPAPVPRSAAKRPAAAPSGLTGWPSRLRLAPGIGGPLAAAALAGAFFIGALTQPFSTTARPSVPSIKPGGRPVAPVTAAAHVVLKPLPGTTTSSLAVAYMPGGGHMVLSVRNLPRSAPGSYYELWLMTSNTHLVSVTSFRVGASRQGSLQLVLPDNPAHYKYLDISVQHVGAGITISQDNVLRGSIPA